MNVIRSSLFSTLSRFGWIALLLLSAGVQSAHAERKTTYYHTDGLGSVVAASNDAGDLLWTKEYAPFGEQLDSTAEQEKLAYTGKEHDDATGLTYFGARYYDPHLGRFMSVDPVGFVDSNPMSFNRYAYANSNPYKYVDPDGRLPILVPLVIFIAKEAAAEVASQATGGATDFLSVRRMGTKGAKFALKRLSQHLDANDVAKASNSADTAANSAEAAADAAKAAGRTSGAAAELRVGDRVFTDVSTGGASRTLHPQVQSALDNVPQAQRAPWHGGCAEVGCLSQALNAGVNPAGGTSRAVNIGTSGRGHGTSKPTCSSCKAVLDQFGVKHD